VSVVADGANGNFVRFLFVIGEMRLHRVSVVADGANGNFVCFLFVIGEKRLHRVSVVADGANEIVLSSGQLPRRSLPTWRL